MNSVPEYATYDTYSCYRNNALPCIDDYGNALVEEFDRIVSKLEEHISRSRVS